MSRLRRILAYHVRYEFPRWLFRFHGYRGFDALKAFTAWHIPRWLVYWVLCRVGVEYIRHDEVVPEATFMEVWGRV